MWQQHCENLGLLSLGLKCFSTLCKVFHLIHDIWALEVTQVLWDIEYTMPRGDKCTQRVTGAVSPAGSVQAHVWHPRGELGPHAACPHHTGHWAFLLCVFLVNSFSQRAELWWGAAWFVVSLWGLMRAQSSGLGHASANILHDLSSIPANTGPHGLSEETSDPPESFSWHHKAHWNARDLLPFQNLSSHLRSASKSLWSVGTQSALNETLFHYTLALVSRTVQE